MTQDPDVPMHPFDRARRHWRDDRGLLERVCEHGVGHPDPEDLAEKLRTHGQEYVWAMAVHGCDGCCRRARNEGD